MTLKTYNLNKIKILILAVFSFVGFAANGQEGSGDSEGDVVDLDAYIVAANRMQIDLGKVGTSVTVLDRVEIEKFQSTLATEAIRNIPGIYVRNNGGVGNVAGISMRGLPVVPLVLIDGVEVNSPISGSFYNFGNLPTVAIERIEVVRGAQSALYGANALTGVISVETKSSLSEGFDLNFGWGYGSSKTISGYATAVGQDSFFDFSAVATTYETDGFSAQPESFGPEWADEDAHEVKSVHGRFGFDVSEKIKASLVLHYNKSESEYDPGTPSPWSTPIFDNFSTLEQQILKAQVDVEITDEWNAIASFTYNEMDDFNQNAWGSTNGEARLSKFDLISQFSANDQYKGLIGIETEEAVNGIANVGYETTSIFTENVYEVSEALTLTAGARVDDNDTYGSETTWRASFAYNISDSGWKFRGSYGTGFDAPEVSQLFGAFGNPNLEAEKGSSYDLGLEWTSSNALYSAGLNYYNVDIEDRVEFLRSTFSFANVNWISSGIEAFVQASLSENTHLFASYNYANAERERAVDTLILESPEAMWSVVLDQEFMEDAMNIRLTAQHVGERESWEGPNDSFFTIDLSASYQLNANVKLWVRVDNLLDEEYQEIFNYNGAPQAFSVGFNYQL